MKELIIDFLGKKYTKYELDKAIRNIPEIYSIILKEREMMYLWNYKILQSINLFGLIF